MTKIFAFFAILIFAALFNPLTVYASNSRNLQPGRTYVFTGLDPRVITHVDVGDGRFEFVELNNQGELLRFGTSSRRFTISGTSITKITPMEPLRVTFTANRIAIEVVEGTALTRTILYEGETAVVRNIGLADVHIRMEGNGDFFYDIIVVDSFGEAVRFDFRVRLPQQNVPGGGFARLTANEGVVTIYYPSFLDGNYLQTLMQILPVMATHELVVNRETLIANNSEAAINFTVRTSAVNVMFRHTFVLRGRDGHVVSYGNRAQNAFAVPPGHTIYITPLVGAELVFPRFFLERITVGYGENIPVRERLQKGETITVTNTGQTHTHRVFFTGGAAREAFSLDHVTYQGGRQSWGMQQNVVGEWATNLAPGATLTITITDTNGYVAAHIPNVDDIRAVFAEETAKIRYLLEPGESVYVRNSGREMVTIQTISEHLRPRPDFVLYDLHTGNILSFGSLGASGNIDLDRQESVLLTGASYPITVLLPRFLTQEGISISPDDRQAIERRELVYGETLQIDNLDRLYNRFVLVEDETPERATRRGFRYDFTLTSITAGAPTFFDFGMNNLGLHLLPPNRRLNIMPNEDSVLTVAFPAEWGEFFRIRSVDGEPLFSVTITPGRRLQVHNRSRSNFVLATNAALGVPVVAGGVPSSNAGFHVQREGELVRVYEQVQINIGETLPAGQFFPPGWSVVLDEHFDGLIGRLPRIAAPALFATAYRYVYVPALEVNINRDSPSSGGIHIAAGERATIIAALGEDLTIWMPMSWARQLGILR